MNNTEKPQGFTQTLMRGGKALITPPQGLHMADMIAMGCIMVSCFLLFKIRDVDFAASFSNAFWEGHFFDFYKFNKTAPGVSPLYPLPLYLLLALWNMPLQLFGLIDRSTAETSFFLSRETQLAWIKLLLLLFFALCSVTIYKIARLVAQDDGPAKLCAFLFVSNPLVIYTIFISGGYDIFALTFMMLGLHAFLQHKRREFILWFALAAVFQYYALLPFVPLLLLDEKKALKILRGLLAGIAPALVFFILARLDRGAGTGGDPGNFGKILQAFPLRIGPMMMPVFFALGYLAICVFAQIKRTGDDMRERQKYAALLPLATMSLLFVYMTQDMKWLILTAPWLTLAFLFSPNRTFSLLFETVGMAALFMRVLYSSQQLHPPTSVLPYVDVVTLIWLLSPFLLQFLQRKESAWPEPGLFKSEAGYIRLRCYGALAVYLLPVAFERIGMAWFPITLYRITAAISSSGTAPVG